MKKIKRVGESSLETMREANAPSSQTIGINQDFTSFAHAIKISSTYNAAKL